MKVNFIGLGYIGLPTAIIAAKHGIEIAGTDINPDIVEATNQGHLHIVEPDMEDMLREVVANGKLKAYTEPQLSDAYFIVVPTPFKGNHEPDITYVEAATRSVVPFLKEGDLFVIESTSPVGTTEKMRDVIVSLRPELEGKIFMAYCPERVLPGNVAYELINNDRVIGGINPQSTEKAKEFYSQFVKGALHSTDSRTAEMCKLTENASRDVQIAFANELSLICAKAGINVWKLIELANRHPRVNILQPGCGVGGHCIAVDPYFITADFPEESKLIAQARETNNGKAEWCTGQILAQILKFEKENGRKPRVALMGLAFKPNIDDLRESPAMEIAKGVTDAVESQYLMVVEPNIKSHPRFALTGFREAYDKADIVVFLVNHREFAALNYRTDVKVLDFCGVFKLPYII
ncbi:MAG: UDP-N-acetyl-D-mannosamine dehydrogenase [Bacteroidaceae bacterium]|jgi:UDP-N-acetyl-D-mannosaminuronic acid dehydrogenase|nr:UDP-N-acetyl-D-mannosamine dehydrogenase [Bacteroidaceae bacterium]